MTPPTRPNPGAAAAGFFYADQTTLPAGPFAARFQVMAPPTPAPGTALILEIRRLDGEGTKFVARHRWPVDAHFGRLADNLLLHGTLAADTPVELRAWASQAREGFRLRAVKVQATRGDAPLDWSGTHASLDRWPLDRLRSVMIGNSGVCTASCVHCPTNKPWLAVPAGRPMTDAIFTRLLDGLVEAALPITGAVGFGLFGDPLTDRQLSQRILRIKAVLPGVPVTISTTAAAFAPRQIPAIQAADTIGVHVESLIPETYERLMAPLRFADVIPRVERLVAVAGARAVLALPVHRENRHEIAAIEAWWARIGGGCVEHQPFTNRLNLDPGVLAMHLDPITGACTQDLAYDLIVDWDGRLLNCCNDFAKRSDLGSLAESPLPALLADARRKKFFQLLRRREWQRIEGCATCLFDRPGAVREAVEASRQAHASASRPNPPADSP